MLICPPTRGENGLSLFWNKYSPKYSEPVSQDSKSCSTQGLSTGRGKKTCPALCTAAGTGGV